jgi:hypothetical protein
MPIMNVFYTPTVVTSQFFLFHVTRHECFFINPSLHPLQRVIKSFKRLKKLTCSTFDQAKN